jgi:hypothetical protein
VSAWGDRLRRAFRVVARDPLYAPRVLWAVLKDPFEGRERIAERLAEWSESPDARPRYAVTPDWEARVHHLLGARWPCPAHDEFAPLWTRVVGSLVSSGLAVGRGSYGGWDDADPALARLVWCATLHRKPEQVVETGVARGITTRFILEALERNGRGRLWSVDVPPLIVPRYRSETGAAVPAGLRDRWTYLEGSSRKRLPALVRRLGQIQLFVHDSMHTTRNLRFELSLVWAALAPGGMAVADDIERNSAFAGFAAGEAASCPTVVGIADDGRANIGIAIRRSDAPRPST